MSASEFRKALEAVNTLYGQGFLTGLQRYQMVEDITKAYGSSNDQGADK